EMLGTHFWKAAAILAAFATVSLSTTARADEELPADVVAAAKKEGKVAFYTSFLGAKAHLDIIKTFEAKYGIPVELLDVRASEMTERIRTEQTSQRYIGDVVQNGAASLIQQEKDGILQPHGGIPNAKNLLPEHKATDVRVPCYVLGYGILVNTNLVKPDEIPKSWLDLKSLPVKFIGPAEGLPYIRFDFGVLKGAPHPNAARLFINHYLGEQVQTMYANAGLIPVVGGVLDKAGEAGQELKSVKLMGTTSPDTLQKMLDRAK